MRWITVHLDQIRSEAGHTINRVRRRGHPDRYSAFGPPGSQDISFIQENTAQHMRMLWNVDRRPEDVRTDPPGQACLGWFATADEARAACEARG